MAELVIADAAYKTYPGGVFVLRASDWMGPARGSLTSANDADAISGVAVQDSQKVTTSIYNDPVDAFVEADDTLVVALDSLPLEEPMLYTVFASILIDGDWDVTNLDTTIEANQYRFQHACELGWYGDALVSPTEADFTNTFYKPRGRTQYIISRLGQFKIDTLASYTLHFRAYAQTATTIVWNIDQLFFLPLVRPPIQGWGTFGEWLAEDFYRVGGAANLTTTQTVTDGADSGSDSLGKFTWHPVPLEDHTGWTGETVVPNYGPDGGGDFQKSPDSEYDVRIVAADALPIVNTVPTPDAYATAHCYGLHGPDYRSAATWVDDLFTRTVASGWGAGPQGFAWKMAGAFAPNTYASVSGGKGIITHTGELSGTVTQTLGASPSVGAEVLAEDCVFSGTVWINPGSIAFVGGTPPFNTVAAVRMQLRTANASAKGYFIEIDLVARTWALWRTHPDTKISGDFNISSWFDHANDLVGFKLEIRRYVLRCKLWDASGAEPGTWAYEDFRPVPADWFGGTTWYTYPYSDIARDAAKAYTAFWPHISDKCNFCQATYTNQWDDIKVEYSPGGSIGDAWARMEQPEGTLVDEIEIPAGALQLVYWGTRNWTDGIYLDFSSRVWSDAGSAELQIATAAWWWFRSVHKGKPQIVRYR